MFSRQETICVCSAQGYGEKAPGTGFYVYPGSGATCDTRPVQAAAAEPSDAAGGSSMVEGIQASPAVLIIYSAAYAWERCLGIQSSSSI